MKIRIAFIAAAVIIGLTACGEADIESFPKKACNNTLVGETRYRKEKGLCRNSIKNYYTDSQGHQQSRNHCIDW